MSIAIQRKRSALQNDKFLKFLKHQFGSHVQYKLRSRIPDTDSLNTWRFSSGVVTDADDIQPVIVILVILVFSVVFQLNGAAHEIRTLLLGTPLLRAPIVCCQLPDRQCMYACMYILYSTPLHLPPLRLHCVRGCWNRTQVSCDFGIGCQTT